jgi:hypothetical protein
MRAAICRLAHKPGKLYFPFKNQLLGACLAGLLTSLSTEAVYNTGPGGPMRAVTSSPMPR